MAQNTMGLDFGLQKADLCMKRKFRWKFAIPDVSVTDVDATLPHVKGARPSLSFKEIDVQHLTETIYYPVKPEWKPVSLILYDLKKPENPVIKWFKNIYDAQNGTWKPVGDGDFKKDATLTLLDGMGTPLETWTLENIWPQSIEFGELDMGSSDYVTIELTLRYDRAYQKE